MGKPRQLDSAEETIVRRAAMELGDGMVVNLGIGLPTLVPAYLPEGVEPMFHSENGFLGMGAPLEDGTPDHDVIDAGGQACELVSGGAFFDSLTSFAIVRGGNLDVAILGAFEVSVRGDLANWKIPGKLTPGMGGAMELAQKANSVLIISRHLDRKGRPKLVESCSLPVTAWGCVDTLITERAVFRKRGDRLVLTSVHPDHTIDEVLGPINASIDIPVEVEDPQEPWDISEKGDST